MKSFLVLAAALLFSCVSFSQSIHFTTKKCKNASNDRVRKDCIIKEIQAFVDSNYDITAISSDARPGPNRVYTRFKIDKTGKIVDIQTKSTAFPLEVEAIRVLESFPNLILSKKTKNKNAIIREEVFTLPIVFNVNKTEIDIDLNKGEKITGNQ